MNEKIITEIGEARKKAGLTQEEFSKQFSISIDTIKSWESGRRKPPVWAEKLLLEKLNSMKKPQ